MSGGLPRWSVALLRALSPPGELDDVLGDLDEARRHRLRQRGGPARLATAIDTLDMAMALVRARVIRARIHGSTLMQDYKLGLRMLAKYPGLTIAGGLALAIAIGIGAAWFDVTRQMWRPTIPLPEGDRIVEIEMRDPRKNGDEHRIMHDFVGWRRAARAVTDLGAYRTVQRNLVIGGARLEPVTAAEITASALALARVPPLLGRPLLEADERPGAAPVVVLGYTVWQRQFGGRPGIVGQPIQIGRDTTTVVGVMPEGFAFPVNHRLWTPLTVSPAGYEPLTGPPITVVARLAPGFTQAQAYAEVTTLTDRVRRVSPATHEHLRPRVLAYGGQSPGDAAPPGVRQHAPAHPAGDAGGVRERRHARLRAHRHPRRRDRDALRARRQPRAHRLATVRRGARPVGGGRGRRADRRALHPEVGDPRLQLRRHGRPAVLGAIPA